MNVFKRFLHYIKLVEDRTSYPETFKEELNYQSSRILTFASLITLGWLFYIPIDLQLHPDATMIIVLRIGFPIIGLLLFVSRFIERLRSRSLLLLTLFGAYLEISTGILTACTGGDPAYIGGYLFVLMVLAIAPLQRSAAYSILGASLTCFFGILSFKGIDIANLRTQYSINDIISTTIVISCFIYILNNTRFVSWQKSRQVENNQHVIEDQKNQLENQIVMAGELQKALLPRDIPVLDEALISYKYNPMMELGGDFVDIIYNDAKKHVGLFVCDVSGHGVAGALVSSMVKMSLNRWNDTIDQPSKTLLNIYQSLAGKMDNHFVTAGVCSIDLKTGILTYSSAGHPPLIIARKNGEIDLVNSRGRIIAEIMPPNYEEARGVISEGDSIILYTDGITECFGEDNVMLGEDAFYEMIRKNIHHPPWDMSRNIFKELTNFNGSENFMDDVSILIMKYRGNTTQQHKSKDDDQWNMQNTPLQEQRSKSIM
ncbi:MAG TPA: PP2C family protein-serine/threonine phosphatase [Spirochaetota bacterium]|nr:PP2C family protein-serine/threonine phosphatase [Spirochaetota bacterium]